MKKIITFIKKYPILIPLILFVLLRIPSLFEGYWYGDEGIYAAVAQGMHQGKLIFTAIWDHKPPLLEWVYYLESFAGWDVGLMLIKLTSIGLGGLCLIYLGKIVKLISGRKLLTFLVTMFFAVLAGSVLLEGDIANGEVFFILFNILIFYYLLQSKRPVLVGVLLFLGFLTKPQSFLEGGMMIGVWALARLLRQQAFWKYLLKAGAAFLALLAGYTVILQVQGNLPGFIDAVFLQNFAYASDGASSIKLLGFTVSAMAVKILILLSVLGISSWLYHKKNITVNNYLIINLFNVELFMVLFGGRSYPHYLIQLLPALAIIFGLLMVQYRFGKLDFYKNLGLFVLLLFITMFLFLYHGDSFSAGSFYMPPVQYYTSFVKYIFTPNKNNFNDSVSIWQNIGSGKRFSDFADYFNSHYQYAHNCYIYTESAWAIALTDIPTTNKYVVWWHLGFSDTRMQEGIKEMQSADLVVIDNKAPVKYEQFFANFDQYRLIDTNNDFAIYQKIN